MPLHFFSKKSILESAEEKITTAKNLLESIDEEKKSVLITLIDDRIQEFKDALSDDNATCYEKNKIKKQYYKFANTLYHCVHKPELASCHIIQYFDFNYYPVGIKDIEKTEPINRNLSFTAAGLGVALVISSIPTFMFNPLIGIVLLSVGITLLLPTFFSLIIPDSLDTRAKKTEEKGLFEMAVQLKKPTIKREQDQEYELNFQLL